MPADRTAARTLSCNASFASMISPCVLSVGMCSQCFFPYTCAPNPNAEFVQLAMSGAGAGAVLGGPALWQQQPLGTPGGGNADPAAAGPADEPPLVADEQIEDEMQSKEVSSFHPGTMPIVSFSEQSSEVPFDPAGPETLMTGILGRASSSAAPSGTVVEILTAAGDKMWGGKVPEPERLQELTLSPQQAKMRVDECCVCEDRFGTSDFATDSFSILFEPADEAKRASAPLAINFIPLFCEIGESGERFAATIIAAVKFALPQLVTLSGDPSMLESITTEIVSSLLSDNDDDDAPPVAAADTDNCNGIVATLIHETTTRRQSRPQAAAPPLAPRCTGLP